MSKSLVLLVGGLLAATMSFNTFAAEKVVAPAAAKANVAAEATTADEKAMKEKNAKADDKEMSAAVSK